jgi:hypothetical protein
MQSKQLFVSSFILAGISGTAYGYIDPGVGSMLVQGILAGGAGALFFIRLFWGRIISRLRPTNSLKKQNASK